jgi:CIC family chloride channel protein
VGIIGYFVPRTLGLGYENISDIASGNISLREVALVSILKYVSWVVVLSAGTAGKRFHHK